MSLEISYENLPRRWRSGLRGAPGAPARAMLPSLIKPHLGDCRISKHSNVEYMLYIISYNISCVYISIDSYCCILWCAVYRIWMNPIHVYSNHHNTQLDFRFRKKNKKHIKFILRELWQQQSPWTSSGQFLEVSAMWTPVWSTPGFFFEYWKYPLVIEHSMENQHF